MDYAACNVVYVDRTAREDRLVKRDDDTLAALSANINHGGEDMQILGRSGAVDHNLHTLLGTFSEVFLCTSGKSCISKLSELNRASIVDLIPTLVLIDIPYKDQLQERPPREIRTPSPSSKQQIDGLQEDQPDVGIYGLSLLRLIASEIQYQSLSKLVVPVAVVAIPEQSGPTSAPRRRANSKSEISQLKYDVQDSSSIRQPDLVIPLDQERTMRYLDVGAVDVLTSPLLRERLPSLAIHAYRAHKDASKDQRALLEMKRGRKRSWVGLDDQKPYAYLREAMVSGLMDGICKMGGNGNDEPCGHMRISIAADRRELIAAAIGSWHFSAHEFTDDELLHAALLMLQHALAMPELGKWRISTENLTGFLVVSRSAYNAFVPYHNFRHVVDVLQAIFHFLVQLGTLPSYPYSATSTIQQPQSPIAALIRPFDALTLLITAIGHDVGHPGVNNTFLVTLNAPLAQLYNDRSVLESFHCAAYSQILRRHWPAAFQGVEMRQLMISSILATDMGLHFDYMKRLGYLQEKLYENGGTEGWNGRLLEEQRTLACSLLIKCADISNVARRYDVAAQWTMILTDEFARQASMEADLGIPSALFAAPVREIIELGKSQISFMNMFAMPLFQGVTDVMPAMQFCVDELHQNKTAWEQKVAQEQEKHRQNGDDSVMLDGMFSPRAMSVATPSDATSHQKIGNVTSSIARANNISHLRIKEMLTRSPFTPADGIVDEAPEDLVHHSMPEISTGSIDPGNSTEASPRESLSSPTSSMTRRSSKPLPSQLQLSYATVSAPGLLDCPSKDTNLLHNERQQNGVIVEPSLVVDAVVVEPTPRRDNEKLTTGKQRSSDTTESSNSAAGDWASQATSATTSKMPLSPSTQGTSIMSQDSVEKNNAAGQTPTGASPSNKNIEAPSVEMGMGTTTDAQLEGKGLIMETVRNLKKKPSRFRMNGLNFWKKSKSASPPMPVGAARERNRLGPGSEEGGQ